MKRLDCWAYGHKYKRRHYSESEERHMEVEVCERCGKYRSTHSYLNESGIRETKRYESYSKSKTLIDDIIMRNQLINKEKGSEEKTDILHKLYCGEYRGVIIDATSGEFLYPFNYDIPRVGCGLHIVKGSEVLTYTVKRITYVVPDGTRKVGIMFAKVFVTRLDF
ncbi:hypothetical protein D1872_81520 [compost metagenome]